MTNSSVFTSERGQIICLPNEAAFPADVHHVDVLKIGNSLLITPQSRRWDDLFKSGPRVSKDFMAERDQSGAEGDASI